MERVYGITEMVGLGIAILLLCSAVTGAHCTAVRLLPDRLPMLEWTEFQAAGYPGKVSGLIFDARNPADNGMPLGGIETGCLDLETTGELGYCTIFNSFFPRRQINLPFLGLSVDKKVWLLSARSLPGVKCARNIRYWGHYPIADLDYEMHCPVKVEMRAWSPFIPGDVVNSNVPGAVFEVRLRNDTGQARKCTLAMSFPGHTQGEAWLEGTVKEAYHGSADGITGRMGPHIAFFVGAIGQKASRIGGGLSNNGERWSGIADALPPYVSPDQGNAGVSAAYDFTLKPNERKTVRLLLAWYAPMWNGQGYGTIAQGWAGRAGQSYLHMYGARFGSLRDVVDKLAGEHESLLKRIISWQSVIYADKTLPVWLRDTLVNSLHMITETSVWAQAKPPVGDWCRAEDGFFAMNESPRSSPQMECIPCAFYGNLPIVYFFPKLALSNLRAHKAYQLPSGRPVFIFGPAYEVAVPNEGYQHVLNGSCYAEIFDKLWLARGRDAELLKEFYPSLKKATEYTMTLRPEYGVRQVISMPTGNQGDTWHESTQFYGMVTQVAGAHLAHLQMACEWAEAMGDKEWLAHLQGLLKGGSDAAEEFLWTGSYYRLYNEPETGHKSDVMMGYQLDGEWISLFHGYKGVFKHERAAKALETLKGANADPEKWPHGALVFGAPDGGIIREGFDCGYWTNTGMHAPACLMLGMTYIYNGQKEFGLELCRRTMSTIVRDHRGGWDWGILYKGDTGLKVYGNDYYQDLILWSLPAAIEGKPLDGPVAKGGLVDRIIRAGNTSR
ncbi:MAG: GH116 family glycosyl-hydrolase [Armatimonadota bacterium]|nr:GH116 family glycosyl-hydrolase [Armatimonadota bacterium]